MRRWFWLTTLCLLPAAIASAEDTVAIDELLQDFDRAQAMCAMTAPNPESCGGALAGAAADPDLAFLRQRFSLDPNSCRGPLDVTDVCKQVASDCWHKTGSQINCHARKETRLKRMGSQELRERIYRFAGTTFHKFTQDPEIHRLCCGDNRACAESFAKTKLLVIQGLSPNDMTAYYQPAVMGLGRSVKISEARLLQARTEQSLEHIFLHELGHACQQSRREIHGSSLSLGLSYALGCNDPGISQQDLQNTLGQEVTQCVLDKLTQAQAASPGACLGAWTIEAFAESIFVSKRSEPGHHAWNCDTHSDKEHASAQTYMPCLLNMPQVKKNLCTLPRAK